VSARLATLLAPMLLYGVLSGCDRGDSQSRWVGTLERDRIELVAEESEPILSLDVREGEHVTSGQVLVHQETEVARARASQAEAQVAEAQQHLVELVRGERVEVVRQAQARVAAARAMDERDQREFRRVSELVRQRLVSQTELDQARAATDASQASLHEAEEQLGALLRGNRVEDIDQARAAVSAAQAAARELEVTNARLVVRATRPGVIEALPYRMGERPPKGNPVVVMLADTPAFARVYVPESERIHVRPGTRAQIYVDGRSQPFNGFVRYVASDAAFTPYYALTQRDRSRLAFLAEVEVTGAEARDLPAGVPVEVTIQGAGRG
jgi:HlyD family secretion protein